MAYSGGAFLIVHRLSDRNAMIRRSEIQTVVSTLAYTPEELELIRRAFEPAEFVQCDKNDKEALCTALQRAQVAVLAGDLDDLVMKAPHLQWVHCDHAGLNKSARPEVFAKGLVVTGSAGRSGPALAQHGFFFALGLTYQIRRLIAHQASHKWRPKSDGFVENKAMWGQRLGIVGFGHTGREMAHIGRAFGMHVTVLRRSIGDPCPDVDIMLSSEAGDDLDQILQCDVVMLATSLSDQTFHLFSTEQFRRMKKTSFIVNMARGEVIDELALIEALRTGEIAGAGLDVFETEPLPAASPLWDLPNVIMTPHTTPQMPNRTQRSIDIIVENVSRYKQGQPMLNKLDMRDIMTKTRDP